MTQITKTLPTNLGYYSPREGNTIHIESQADVPADLTPYRVVKFKRGVDINLDLKPLDNTDYLAFGDEAAPKPIIRHTAGAITENNKIDNIVLADLDFRGGRRGLSFYAGSNMKFLRCNVQDTEGDSLSAGFYFKLTNGIDIQQCTSENTYGDVVYCDTAHNIYIAHNDFGSVNGSAGDSIQITAKDELSFSTNVMIEHNICRTNDGSTSGKGAIVVNKTDGYIIRDNDVEGQYFGIGVTGKNGLIENNTIHNAGMAYPYGYGIGIGGEFDADNIQVINNTINNCKRGFAISDANTANPHLRTNLTIKGNTINNAVIGAFIDVPYTGIIKDNDYVDCAVDAELRNGSGKFII